MPVNISDLENKFGAERSTNKSDNDFLNQRFQIEEEMPELLSIEEFLNHFNLFKKYGLENVMLERVEHEIWYNCHYKSDEFRKSEFYDLFKDKRTVKKHFNHISEE